LFLAKTLATRHWVTRILAAVALVCAGLPAQTQTLEFAVKANYLVRFAAFVEWPAEAFASPTAPITLCVIGRDPFGVELDRAVRGQAAHGRALAVRRLRATESIAACHIAYVGAGGAVDAALGNKAVPTALTVTDETSGAERGAIHFVVVDKRVRFAVDQSVAARAHLTIDSRLLSLAVSVKGGE
jgi:hypothetical protein